MYRSIVNKRKINGFIDFTHKIAFEINCSKPIILSSYYGEEELLSIRLFFVDKLIRF